MKTNWKALSGSILLLVGNSCSSNSGDVLFDAPFDRFKGYAQVQSINRVNASTVKVKYRISNPTERDWCLSVLEEGNGLALFDTTDRNLILQDLLVIESDYLSISEKPGRRLYILGASESITHDVPVSFDTLRLTPGELVGSFYSQVHQSVIFCDRLDNPTFAPGNFRYIESTDTVDGNSFLLTSDFSDRFTLSK